LEFSTRLPPVRTDGARRREALLDAALKCFADRGILATGIEEIRREAGASASSVYHQFDGLPAIVLALLTRTFERLFAHLAARVTVRKSARGAVIALVDGHIEWIVRHRAEGRFMYEGMSLELPQKGMRALQARKAELLTPVVEHFGTFIERGHLPRLTTAGFEVVLLGSAHEGCRRWVAGAPIDPDWMRATLPKLAWKAIKPSRSAT
jgi:AcrR family transcriptional regulator